MWNLGFDFMNKFVYSIKIPIKGESISNLKSISNLTLNKCITYEKTNTFLHTKLIVKKHFVFKFLPVYGGE